MIENPLVSVLMPAFNAEKYIHKAIKSVIEQSYGNWELLILNDASTDKTNQIIGGFEDKRIRVFSNSENMGYLRSCNRLFGEAKGDVITFLDADDTCSSQRLTACVEGIQDCDFLTTDFDRISAVGKRISNPSIEVDYTRYATDQHYQPIVCCATIFLKSELFRNVGGYHEFFDQIGGEDYYWLFKLSRAGKGKHLAQTLYSYRMHDEQSQHVIQNPLKFYLFDILKEIKTSEITSDKTRTDIDSGLKSRWLNHIKSNPSELRFRIAGSLLNRNEKKKALSTASSALIRSPFSFTHWYRFFYLSYSILMR